MFISASELLKRATPLYAVADGRKSRSMIDAVRDAMPNVHENYDSWRTALDSLTEAAEASGLFCGFQSWEVQQGRTVEECRAVFVRAVPIAENAEREKRKRELQECRCCCH